jgi:hypothetical protein
MCDTSLVIRGERRRLAEFLDEIGLDRRILAEAEERMGRLVESKGSRGPVLHLRASLASLNAYCGAKVEAPEGRWASPAWIDRDPDSQPERCSICDEAAKADSPWTGAYDRRGMLSFEDILPPPPGLPPEEDRRWVVEHWGTKWNLGFTGSFIEEEEPEMIKIKLETAWGPPLPVVDEMARRAPDLEFSVTWNTEFVGASDDVGEATWREGERVHYHAHPHYLKMTTGAIEKYFNEYFRHWKICLPHEAVAGRSPGHIFERGWHIGYVWGAEGGEEYLEVLAQHRMTDDRHFRVFESGRVEHLPAAATFYVYGADATEEEIAAARTEYVERNRRIYDDLHARGLLHPNRSQPANGRDQ